MEEMNTRLRSIWGNWWVPLRKWFYPLWLNYETLIHFYEYADAVQSYFGESGRLYLGTISGIATFAICTAFLTAPACFILFKFFDTANLTGSPIEAKVKPIF